MYVYVKLIFMFVLFAKIRRKSQTIIKKHFIVSLKQNVYPLFGHTCMDPCHWCPWGSLRGQGRPVCGLEILRVSRWSGGRDLSRRLQHQMLPQLWLHVSGGRGHVESGWRRMRGSGSGHMRMTKDSPFIFNREENVNWTATIVMDLTSRDCVEVPLTDSVVVKEASVDVPG